MEGMTMTNVWSHFTFVAILVVGWAAPVRADEPVSGEQMDQILAELRQIRKLLEAQPNTHPQQATRTRIDVANAPFLGSKDAPVTIVEFMDYQCRFCQQFHQQTFQDLKKHYIDSGKVRFYSMDLPLEIHQNALLAAQAGRCAGEQGKFWLMHDRMLANPDRLEFAKLVDYAQEFGVDVAAFRQCVESGKYKEAIQQGARDVTNKGAGGTPAFVIGKSTPGGVEGWLVVGAVPYGVFEQKLKEFPH